MWDAQILPYMTILKIELFHGTMLQTTNAKPKTKQVQIEKKGKK